MSKSRTSLSQRDSYVTNKWDTFFWWLSTAEKELLINCVIDRNRYKIIGATVLATWSFASLAWTYFWYTITNHFFISVLLGFFMGLIILSIDRVLIKGINKFNKNKIAPLLLRGILAITLGTFMAQPAILYMFDKEIKLQASLDNVKRKRDKQQQLDALYGIQKTEIAQQKSLLQKQLNEKYAEVEKARQGYIAEMDGTGGSGKVGLKNIALAKKNEYEKLDSGYKNLAAITLPQIKILDSNTTNIQLKVNDENSAFEGLLNNGFLTRIEALNNLVKNNSALQWRYFLIVVILMLIELMPVLAKSMLPSGTYDDKVRLVEEMEKEIAEKNQLHEKELKKEYNTLAKENDLDFLHYFFEKTKEERRKKSFEQMNTWSMEKHESFDDFWQNLKKNMLTKQEN